MNRNLCLPNASEEIKNEYKTKLLELIKYGTNLNKNIYELERFVNGEEIEDFTNNYTFMTGGDEQLSQKNKDLISSNNFQNTNNKTFNINRDILLRKEQMNQIENEELEDQYKHLDQIQSNIFSKERLIEENLYYSEQSERNIRVLTGSILFVLLLFVVVGIYYLKKIDNDKFVKLCGLLFGIFLLYLCYQYNVFYLKDSLSALFSGRVATELGNKIENKTMQMQEDIQRIREGDYEVWKKKNCSSCSPTPSNDVSGLDIQNLSGYGYSSSYFTYQDGSTPNQLINPENSLANSGFFKDKIHHTDVDTVNDRDMRIVYQEDSTNNSGDHISISGLDGDYVSISGLDGDLTAENTYTANL